MAGKGSQTTQIRRKVLFKVLQNLDSAFVVFVLVGVLIATVHIQLTPISRILL
jgi:hypothetical protein